MVDSDVHLFVADVIKSSDTVDMRILDGVLSSLVYILDRVWSSLGCAGCTSIKNNKNKEFGASSAPRRRRKRTSRGCCVNAVPKMEPARSSRSKRLSDEEDHTRGHQVNQARTQETVERPRSDKQP